MIGRRAQQRQLRDIVDSEQAEFVVVYGRRRVGKTYLVRETFQGQFAFAYTGVANVSARVQLAEFVRALRTYDWEPRRPVNDWFDAFSELRSFLESQSGDDPLVVFIDELPWMDNTKSTFIPAFEHFWNSWASGVKRLTLIACGSATAWITKKIFRNHGGLYNRVTRRIHLQPFTLAECEEFLTAKGVVWNRHDIVESYMIFGGIPYYLSLMERHGSLAQNVDALCFATEAPLAREFDELFDTLFSHAGRHLDVIQALAAKRIGLTRAEVAAAVGFPDGGNLTRILAELEESGFIRTYQPFGRLKKGALIQLCDAFTSFHLTFMTRRPEQSWSSFTDNAQHRAWSGLAFERVCLVHVHQIRQALGIGGVLQDTSSWRSTGEPGAQVDLVIDRNDNVINLCEMKYANSYFSVDQQTDQALRNKAAVFVRETGTSKAVHLTLVTTYGLKRGPHASVFQSLVTMDDLFAPG